jgi:hypothetical protein
VRNGKDYRVHVDHLLDGSKLDSVLVARLLGVCERIVNARLDAELGKLAQDVGDLAVPNIVSRLLEDKNEDPDSRLLHRDVGVDE